MDSPKKSFNRHLIEKGVVTPPHLIEAIIEQQSSFPTALEIFHEKKLLAEDDLLRVIENQQEKGLDFQASCKELGLWDEKFLTTITEEVRKNQQPLTKILVTKLDLSAKSLIESVDDYLSEQKSAPEVTEEPPPQAEPAQEAPAENAEPANALDFSETTELGLEQLTSTYNKAEQDRLLESLRSSEIDTTHIETAVELLHKWVGTATFANAGLCKELFEQLEMTAQLFSAQKVPIDAENIQNLTRLVEKGFSICDRLVQSLTEHKSEKPQWGDSSFQDEYLSLVSDLANFSIEAKSRAAA